MDCWVEVVADVAGPVLSRVVLSWDGESDGGKRCCVRGPCGSLSFETVWVWAPLGRMWDDSLPLSFIS